MITPQRTVSTGLLPDTLIDLMVHNHRDGPIAPLLEPVSELFAERSLSLFGVRDLQSPSTLHPCGIDMTFPAPSRAMEHFHTSRYRAPILPPF